jgi:hypothetical protein
MALVQGLLIGQHTHLMEQTQGGTPITRHTYREAHPPACKHTHTHTHTQRKRERDRGRNILTYKG